MRSAEPNGEKDIPPQPGGEERRGDRRHLSILRVGKLIADDIQELCVVHNISSGGLKARVYSDKTVGQRIAVELKSGQEMAGTVQWAVGNEIGIQFDEKIDVPALLASDEVVTRG